MLLYAVEITTRHLKEQINGQTVCLNNSISRNKLCVSWNHPI